MPAQPIAADELDNELADALSERTTSNHVLNATSSAGIP
jgi:hypothetical protein